MKKLRAVPVSYISTLSGKEFVEQAIIYDETWIVAAVHVDMFFSKDERDDPNSIYNRLLRKETVEFTLSVS